mmetsp:Transcript_38858/g.62569  ORF Transcript_38858/g.62569 Transcript_38858/m.62569 type:complete len:86 (-) Transcript_38858:2264-2521(-)
MTVLATGLLIIRDSTRCSATAASTAAKGSSAINTCGSANNALAIAKRCFCPPESVTPRSPTAVSKPSGNCSRSSSRADWASTSAM